jgi:hypothetical protein
MATAYRAFRTAPFSGILQPFIKTGTATRAHLFTPNKHPSTHNLISNPRSFHSSGVNMADNFLAAIKARRTYYQLEPSSTISDERIQEIVNHVVLHTPSSFNSQSTRVLVLLGEEHQKLCGDIAKPAVKAVAPAEAWPTTEKKLSGFQNAYGTVRPSHSSPRLAGKAVR